VGQSEAEQGIRHASGILATPEVSESLARHDESVAEALLRQPDAGKVDQRVPGVKCYPQPAVAVAGADEQVAGQVEVALGQREVAESLVGECDAFVVASAWRTRSHV
jgi:hypothetical protein